MALPLQIFKAGRHVAMCGTAIEFSARDLDGIVASYDPKVHEAPLVVGHPTHDAPAYGWVKALVRKGDALEADPDQVNPAFAEAVKAGSFKKVSASFYRPDSPNNPKPGSYYLRHVGFLGAQPPAVKGLRQIAFGDADDCVSFEEAVPAAPPAEQAPVRVTELDEGFIERLLNMFGAKFGLKPVDAPASASSSDGSAAKETTDLAEADPEKLFEAISASFPSTLSDDERAAIKAALEKALAPAEEGADEKAATDDKTKAAPPPADLAEGRKLTAREQELAKRERDLRARDNASFLEGVVREGRALPLPKDALCGLLETLATVRPSADVSFGEGETSAPVDLFKKLLSGLPKSVSFTEVGAGSVDFGDDPNVVARKATEYQAEQKAKGRTISTSEAVRHVKGM